MTTPTIVENHPCGECGELAAHKLHHEVESMTDILEDVHFDECNYEGDWKGEERGWVASMSCHEYELGCYCADSGRCEVCVNQAIDHAEYLRDAAIEDGVAF